MLVCLPVIYDKYLFKTLPMMDRLILKNKRKHVCLIAYSCAPGLGSEEGVGWGWATGLAKYVNICLITRKNNVKLIEKEILSEKISHISVVGVDLPAWLRFWKRGARGVMLYHYFWHLLASRTAAKLRKTIPFDLFHHLNFAVSWQPCWIALKGKSVYGPLDGVGIISPKFWPILGLKNSLKEVIRASIIWFGEKIDPFVQVTHNRCNTIIYRTKFIANRFSATKKNNTIIIPDVGLDDQSIKSLIQLSEEKKPKKKIQLIFMGRFVGRKGMPLAIMGFAKAKKYLESIELVCIGDGPEKQKLQKLCSHLGISSSVKFTGRLERRKAWAAMTKGDIFLYPSLRDAVATVIIEAMGAGLPIICLDKTGPAQVLNHQTGVVIQPGNIQKTVDSLASAIILLVSDPSLRQQMGKTAQKTAAKEHTWDVRAKAMLKVYSDAGVDVDDN